MKNRTNGLKKTEIILKREYMKKYVVGIAEMKISSSSEDEIVTYSLGSCLGITAYDHKNQIGGLLHVMLPFSDHKEQIRNGNPFMYVDTGVPLFINKMIQRGAKKTHIQVNVAGGAFLHMNSSEDHFFKIGKRNFLVLRKLLWKNNILMKSYDIGGDYPRTMSIKLSDGSVYIKSKGETVQL